MVEPSSPPHPSFLDPTVTGRMRSVDELGSSAKSLGDLRLYLRSPTHQEVQLRLLDAYPRLKQKIWGCQTCCHRAVYLEFLWMDSDFVHVYNGLTYHIAINLCTTVMCQTYHFCIYGNGLFWFIRLYPHPALLIILNA